MLLHISRSYGAVTKTFFVFIQTSDFILALSDKEHS
jgi:hypothetical protein